MTLRNHPHLKRVSRCYTLSNALISTCLTALFFGSFSFAAEPDGFFALPKHEHPGILAVHDTLAFYKGTETMPENIWPRVSVPFAVFTITDYLNYEIRGKYGREKQESLNKFLPAKHQKPTPLHLTREAFLQRLRTLDPKQFSGIKPEELTLRKELKNLKAIDLYYAFGYRDDTSGVLPALERFQKALPKCKVTGVQWKRLKENQEREEASAN